MVGFPLSLLVLLNFCICQRLLFFDRFLQNPVLDPLPLHFHLMVIENAIERICPFFGLLTAFPVQLARIVHAFASSFCPAPHIVEPLLSRFPLCASLQSWLRRFWRSH